MKKTIAILALVISAGAFAATQTMDHSTHQNINSTQTTGHSGHQNHRGMDSQIGNLTLEQQEEFNTLHEAHRKDMRISMLNRKEIDIKIQKEMLSEKPNQKNIEKLIDQKSALNAESEKDMLQFRLDMNEKFDIDMAGMMKGKKNCDMTGSSSSKGMNGNNKRSKKA